MEFFVGTSGWSYPWNDGGSLDWYIQNSGLNAIELNFSFYRFPFPSMAESWARRGASLRWSVKVNRLITHVFRFSERALSSWARFADILKPLDPHTDFYLFQLPPSMRPKSAPMIENFVSRAGLGERFALEVRNVDWFDGKWIEWASDLGITWVSIDSPDFPLDVFNTSGLVYVRMHGRRDWYAHLYSEEELREVRDKILKANPRKAHVFFNNDHDMLVNSRRMLALLREAA